MHDAADTSEVKNQNLQDGSFANLPELRLVSDRGAWRKWPSGRSIRILLPSGHLKVKVICLEAGPSDTHNLAVYHLTCSAYCVEQVACWQTSGGGCRYHNFLLFIALSVHLIYHRSV